MSEDLQPLMARRPDGTLSLMFLPPEFARVLLELPAILDADDRPEVQSRRFQDPTDDEDANAEWRRMMHDELAHLFDEARDIVARDLALLERTCEHPVGGRLDIPPEHRNAWISALQNARLALAAAHGVEAEDMEDVTALTEPGERAGALLRIHVLGDMQALLIQEVAPDIDERGPYATDDDEPEFDPDDAGSEEFDPDDWGDDDLDVDDDLDDTP